MTTETKDPLATLFCSMYGDTARATFALQRIGVGAEHLNPRQAAATFWREAFALVDRLGLLPKLVELALADKSVAAFHGALRDAWEEREKAAQTDILATVPAEERERILEAAGDARKAAFGMANFAMKPCPESFGASAYRDTIAREVAAWHTAHPVAEPHVIKDGKADRPGSGLYGRLTGEELQAAREATPETRARAETCNCGHEKVAHAAAGHGACTAVLGEDARCVCRGYSRSDAIPETLTREEAIVAASHLSPAASSMIDLTDPRACLRSFESLRSAPPDFWKARDIVIAYVAHLDRLAAASPEQIAKDHAVGLYRKFDVRRTDGSSDPGGKHEACEYFVLDWQHDPFTVPAVRAYADACEATYPALAADLRAKAEIIAAAPGQTPVAPRDVVSEALAAMVAFFGVLFTRERPDTDPSRAIDLGVAAAYQVDITHPWSGIPVRTLRDLVTLAAEEHAEIRRLASERLTRVAKVRRERKAADRAAGRVTEEDLAAAERCANSLRSVAAYHARVNFGGADGETHARSRTAAENAAELLSGLAAEVRALRAERDEAHAALDPVVSRRDAMADPPLSLTVRCATAARIATELAARPAPAADATEEARRESPIELLAREFDRAAHMQGRGLIDHDRGDCYRDAAKRMRAVDRPGLTEEQARAMAGPLCREMFNRIGLAIGNRIGAPEWMVDMMTAALLRASRGETGPDDQAVCMAAAAKAGWTFDPATGRWSGPARPDDDIDSHPRHRAGNCNDCGAPATKGSDSMGQFCDRCAPAELPDLEVRSPTDSTAELARVLAHVATLPAWCAPTPPEGMRPAALGGECARCLAQPGYHEGSCVRRQARGLTEEQAMEMAREAIPRATPWGIEAVAAALLRASRGEAPHVPGVESEGLGPEPGILAPAATEASPPPTAADQVAIPRAVLERLVEATCYAPNVRVEREIARRALQLDSLRHEPARHVPDVARAMSGRK